MTVKLNASEDNDYVILEWTSDAPGDYVVNPGGVRTPHRTVAISGSAVLHVEGYEAVTMKAGAEVTLPVRTRYHLAVLEPGTIRCFYPKASPEAMEEIRHLAQSVDRTMFEGVTVDSLQEAAKPPPPVRDEEGVIVLRPLPADDGDESKTVAKM